MGTITKSNTGRATLTHEPSHNSVLLGTHADRQGATLTHEPSQNSVLLGTHADNRVGNHVDLGRAQPGEAHPTVPGEIDLKT